MLIFTMLSVVVLNVLMLGNVMHAFAVLNVFFAEYHFACVVMLILGVVLTAFKLYAWCHCIECRYAEYLCQVPHYVSINPQLNLWNLLSRVDYYVTFCQRKTV